MRSVLIGLMSLAVVTAAPSLAFADGDGAAAGAATGAVTGAVVGGPIGAAVGAGVGGIAGGVASDAANPRPRAVIIEPGPATTGGTTCASRTVRTENAYGNSKTVTSERCD